MLLNYFLAVLVLAFSFTGTVFMSGGLLSGYLDIPSILIMVIFPFVYQCLLFGVPTVKIAFAAGFKKDVGIEQVTKAQFFFKSYSKIIWITAFVSVLIGMVAVLKWLEDRAALGPNIALALLSLLYVGLIHLVVIIPNSIFLKKRLIELDSDI
jgi:flagellar motor component MotA